MEFKRRSRASRVFECDSGEGDYRIVRPSGFRTNRDGLDLTCSGRDFEVRTEKEELWLLDGEKTVGYGSSETHRWHLVIADMGYVLDQPKIGLNHSTIETPEGKTVAQVRGVGFPLSRVELINRHTFSTDEQAFLAMVAVLGWRESDRKMMGATAGPGGGG